MYSITDLKKGTLIELDGSVYRVLSYDHASMGRGGAVVRTKLKNLRDGSTLSKTFKGNEKIASAHLEPVAAQYLYSDGALAHFMRLDTYEQTGLDRENVVEELVYLQEGQEVKLLYINDELAGVELPIKVEVVVESADPNVKGDSAGSVMKGCRIETGADIQVPLFIAAGDTIRIDTRTGTYIERV
ncbi:MAG: elongation factor P [Candidatus Saccharimonadales bacterium]